jgi:MFS transporter, FSR family, fosmidomycin resistance protein
MAEKRPAGITEPENERTGTQEIGQFQTDKVLAVSLGHMLHDIYAAFLAPMLPLLVGKLGITLSMAGMLDAVRNAPSLLNPFFGLLADRISVRYFVILSPAVTAVIMSLLGAAPSYTVAVLMLLVMGVSSSLFHVPSPVVIKRFSGSKTGKGMSWYMLGGEFSRTLGPIIITWAVTLWGLEGTWRLMPVGLVASVVLFLKLKDVDGDQVVREGRSIGNSGRRAAALVPLFSSIAGYTAFMMAMKIAVTLYLPAYLVNQGRTLMSASFLLAVLQFAGAAGTLTAGTISDIIGRKRTLYIAGIACPLLMWLFLVSPGAFAVPILAALGFFLFTNGPVLLALVQDAEPDSPSFANGMYMTINFGARALSVFVVGVFIEKVGFGLTYRVAALWAVGVLPLIFFIPEKRGGRPGRNG